MTTVSPIAPVRTAPSASPRAASPWTSSTSRSRWTPPGPSATAWSLTQAPPGARGGGLRNFARVAAHGRQGAARHGSPERPRHRGSRVSGVEEDPGPAHAAHRAPSPRSVSRGGPGTGARAVEPPLPCGPAAPPSGRARRASALRPDRQVPVDGGERLADDVPGEQAGGGEPAGVGSWGSAAARASPARSRRTCRARATRRPAARSRATSSAGAHAAAAARP